MLRAHSTRNKIKMRVMLIHNEYWIFTGEEAVVYNICDLLERRGHTVIKFFRSSTEIANMWLGKLRAFCNGIYSFSSKRSIRRVLSEQKPDIVHIHNLFPFISPSILAECTRFGVPVVMTAHNYRLVCPTGLYATNGQICEKCDNGEYWCVLRNCTGSLPKSIGYALRNYIARKGKFYLDNVTMYACLTEFARQRFIARGFPAHRITVIPNTADGDSSLPEPTLGDYVGFVGRVSPEKGIETLLTTAQKCPSIPFKAAGDCNRMPDVPTKAPPNFRFLGNLEPAQMSKFYTKNRVIVLPSIWFEGFPMVVAEAMLKAKPVICSRIGGLPEIVEEGVTGLLFEPGNADDLAEKIRYLWDRPLLCRRMGQAGRAKALWEYSSEKYYERLMTVYEKAIELGPGGPNHKP